MNRELSIKYYRMVQFTVRQRLQSKRQQFLCPGEKSSFKLTANEDYMTVNTKDKSILFQMPVQISESGFQQSAFAIEASGTSQGDATEVPVGVSVVNITSKNSAHHDGVSLPKATVGVSIKFLRGDYKSTDGGYDLEFFHSAGLY